MTLNADRRRTRSRTPWWVGLAALLTANAALAQSAALPVESQVVALRKGWNAVALRVEPSDPKLSAVFTNQPVDKVATYFPQRTPVEFVQDPAAEPWKQKGWRAWFTPSSPEAVATDLHSVHSGQCYLVHAVAPTTVTVTGPVMHRRTRWKADSFNFVGFPVDPANAPTFGAWFSGSAAHRSSVRPLVYRLDTNDRWAAVDRPESVQIEPGVAYWVFCQGASDYQGPLDVTVGPGAGNDVDFRTGREAITVNVVNRLPVPVAVTLTLEGGSNLPLSLERRIPGVAAAVQVEFSGTQTLGTMEAGGATSARFTLDRAAMTGTNALGVLVVKDDVGGQVRLPVTGRLP